MASADTIPDEKTPPAQRVKPEPEAEHGGASPETSAAKWIRFEERRKANVLADSEAAATTKTVATVNGSPSNQRSAIKFKLGTSDIVAPPAANNARDMRPSGVVSGKSNPSPSERNAIKIEPGHMPEIIDLDATPEVKTKREDARVQTPKNDDAELERMEARKRKLAKDIEELERLAAMKREMDDLEEKIAAARSVNGK